MFAKSETTQFVTDCAPWTAKKGSVGELRWISCIRTSAANDREGMLWRPFDGWELRMNKVAHPHEEHRNPMKGVRRSDYA